MSETEQAALEQPAPEQEEAAPAPQEQQEQEQERERESRLNRRIAQLRAQASTAERDRTEMAQRVAFLEQRLQASQPPHPPPDPQVQAVIEQQAQQIAQRTRTQERIDAFHNAGKEHYPDWTQRCQDLMAMGADPQFAELLIEIPDGYKIAAALRDDPDEVERIAAIRGATARAIELGKYQARLEAKPARQVSKAPPPPKPIEGRAATTFIPQQATMDQLLDHYSREAMEKQRHG